MEPKTKIKTPTHRACSKCKERKSIDFFTGSPTKSGIYKICKICRDKQRNITEKTCSLCGETKTVSNFTKGSTRKDGYQGECKACQALYFYDYHRKNRSRKSAYDKERYKAKKEKIREKGREYYHKNKEKLLEKQRVWAQKNPDLVRKQSAEKRARKRNSIPPWLTEDQKYQIKLMYTLAKTLEKNTGIKYHVDHIIPLKHSNMCGLHVPWNLQVITDEENMRKTTDLFRSLD